MENKIEEIFPSDNNNEKLLLQSSTTLEHDQKTKPKNSQGEKGAEMKEKAQ
jgi:hypothetical protein